MSKKILRKVLAIVICLGMLLGVIPMNLTVSSYAAMEAGLVNGNFEDVNDGKPVGWGLHQWFGTGSFESTDAATGQVHGGTYCMKLIDNSANDATVVSSLKITALQGKRYKASVYSYNTGNGSELMLEFWNASGGRIGAVAASNETQNQWAQVNAEGIAPEGTVKAAVVYYISSVNIGTTYVDDATFEEVIPEITELVNGNFEDVNDGKPVGWGLHQWFGTGSFESTDAATGQVHGGTYSMKLIDNSASDATVVSSLKIKATPGKKYKASVYSYNMGNGSELMLEFWNASGGRIGAIAASNETQNQWTQVNAEGIAPEGTVKAAVVYYISSVNTGITYVDDATFEEVPEVTGLINGGFEEGNDIPTGWIFNNVGTNGTWVWDATQPHNGSKCMKLILPAEGDRSSFEQRDIPVIGGKAYDISVFYFPQNMTGRALFDIYWYNAQKDYISYNSISCDNNAADWTKLAKVLKAPTDASNVTIILQGLDGTGSVYLDDVEVCEHPLEEVVLEETEPVNGGYEGVENGKPVGWSMHPTSGIDAYEASIEQVHSGTYSIKLVDDDTTKCNFVKSSIMNVLPGVKYEASVFSYNLGGESEIILEFLDVNKNCINTVLAKNTSTNEWVKISADGIAPDNAVYADILIGTNTAAVSTSYFDDAMFNKWFPIIVNDHPRLFFTNQDIPELRAKAVSETSTAFGASGKELWTKVETLARSYLTETSFNVGYYGGFVVEYALPPVQPERMPVPPGYTAEKQYPYWTTMSREIQQRLETLSLAYTITGEQEFADRAKSYALSLAGWNTWSDPYYSEGPVTCLDTAHLTMCVSAAYDMLYNILTNEERSIIEDAINKKGLVPLYADAKLETEDNIQAIRAIALGTGALSVFGTNPKAAMYLTRATNYYSWYMKQKMTTGKNEGFLYTSYVMEFLMKVIDQIARVTGEKTLINHPFINDFMVRWPIYSLSAGAGSTANISDSILQNNFYITMNVIGSWLDNGYAGWYLANAKPYAEDFDKFLYFNPDIKITSPSMLPSSAVLDEVGWAALRTGWDSKDTVLEFVSNNSKMTHNHYDQNSFLISSQNTWIAADPGYQDFSPGPANDFTNWVGHNTIQVDGKKQSVKGGGALTKGLLSPWYDYIKGTAASAYTNPKLERFDRHIVFVKPNYYVMLDDLKADIARTFDWAMYSGASAKFEVNGNPVIYDQTTYGNDLYVSKGKAQMAVKFLAPAALPVVVGYYPGATSFGPYARVGSGSPTDSFRFLSVIKVEEYQSGVIKAVDILPPFETSGNEFKTVSVSDSLITFYKSQAVGDYITLKVNAANAGNYDLGVNFIKSPLYGKVQVYLDGQSVGGVYDGYDTEVKAAPLFSLGEVSLSEGDHLIKFEAVGKNENSTNYFIGIDSIQLLPSGGNAIQKTIIDADLLQNDSAIGAEVLRNGEGSITDLIVFKNAGEQSFNISGIESDSEQTVISHTTEGVIEEYSMTRGSYLRFNGKELLKSDKIFSAATGYDTQTAGMKAIIDISEQMIVQIYTGFNTKITMDGQLLDDSSYSYDALTGLVAVAVSQGIHEISFAVRAPEITTTKVGKTTFISVKVKATTDSGSVTAIARVEASTVTALVDKAKEEEASKQKVVVEIKVESAADAKTVELKVPRHAFKQVADTTKAEIKVNTGIGSITFDKKAVDPINSSASTGDISIGIKRVENASLTEEAQKKAGGRPVYDFFVKAGSTEISDFECGNAEISIPYTPKPGEKKISIIVYYIDNTGKLKTVWGKYDTATEAVNFKTSCF